MFRFLRMVVATLVITSLTLFFADSQGILPTQCHLLASIQFLPAILAGSTLVVAALVLATLLFGRIYCSVLCPLGILQDMLAFCKRLVRGKKRQKYEYAPARTRTRALFFLVFIIGLIGCPILAALLDPYSSFGRIASSLVRPVAVHLNNLLVPVSKYLGYYLLFPADAAVTSYVALSVALISFAVIGYLALRYGRLYCNTVCPVGTLLGFLARFSPFRVRIDAEKCIKCKLCATKCKSSCLDLEQHKVDASRCVVCFNCLGNCPKNAIHYGLPVKSKESPSESNGDELQAQKREPSSNDIPADPSKRQFLATLTAVAATAAATTPKALAETLDIVMTGHKPYRREHPITPPGSVSLSEFQRRCTSCHLCVSKCSSKAIKPSLLEYGLAGIMQPVMSFERGFCAYDCTDCGQVCPTGAIRPLTVEQKHQTQAGQVVLILENCVVQVDETSCGACAEHCPTQAVKMVPYKDGLTIPETNPALCIGCGACEYICPVRPYRAIHVKGNPVHQESVLPPKSEKKDVKLDDFGF
ncbi:MAG: 4Fe-4S binding protein [Planctomycetia bacterium]|nr:4Fe-4S binding protein [Planctomycetia bacterium]